MVTCLREINSPTGTLCCQPLGETGEKTDALDRVTCEKCRTTWDKLWAATQRQPPGVAFDYAGTGGHPANQPALFPGQPRPRRTDAQLLELLAKARAAGARELEVRPDGSFRVVLDPAPPIPPAAPKSPTPEEKRAQDDADELHGVEVE